MTAGYDGRGDERTLYRGRTSCAGVTTSDGGGIERGSSLGAASSDERGNDQWGRRQGTSASATTSGADATTKAGGGSLGSNVGGPSNAILLPSF